MTPLSSPTKGFGLPPTPPSSLSSEDSEGNQSPDHRAATSSPSILSSPGSPSNGQHQVVSHQPITSTCTSIRRSAVAAAHQSMHTTNGGSGAASQTMRGYNGSSSRQPISTPLISSQPVITRIHLPRKHLLNALSLGLAGNEWNTLSTDWVFTHFVCFNNLEGVNGSTWAYRGREAHLAGRRLPHSDQTSSHQNRREIAKENSPENQEQGKPLISHRTINLEHFRRRRKTQLNQTQISFTRFRFQRKKADEKRRSTWTNWSGK